ncbi:MAG: SPOR domain-containing protein [Gammaproteobacteria bacterium]|nr:SPOR domain-containing protein [Gammaproteobacteria bacterium]
MHAKTWTAVAICVIAASLSGCNREQSAWEKARSANDTQAYQQFLKQYPNGTYTQQAEARLQDLNEEQDWQKARDTDTAEAYQSFLKVHPEGKWSEEARIRIENFALGQPAGVPPGNPASAASVPAGASTEVAPGPSRPSAAPTGAASPGTKAPAVGAAASAPRPARPRAAPAERAGRPGAPHPPPASRGGYGVQLGAFKSGAAVAMKHWHGLLRREPAALRGLRPQVHAVRTRSGQRLYRLQAYGLSATRARALCRKLRARRESCIVLRPAAT